MEANYISVSDSEMELEDGSDDEAKARYFWEEIMVRDRRRRNTDQKQNDLLGITWDDFDQMIDFQNDFLRTNSDSYGQKINFQKRLLEEAGHVLVAVSMEPPGSKEGRLRSSEREAKRIAEALRCTFANYEDIASSFGSPDVNHNVDSWSCSRIPDVIDDNMLFGVLVHTAASQLSIGHSVVIRAPFPHRARIDVLLDAANSTQAKLIVLELRKKKQVNKELLSEYDLNDVPKLILQKPESILCDQVRDHLDFILLATSMNHWHVGGATESVMEDSECRNKAKLQHFSHRHPLTLIEQKASTESSLSLPIEYYCDCCMEHIMGSDQQYYLCNHCEFSLHKSCAELPQCWDAPFHVHPLRLMVLEHESDRETRIVAFLRRNRTRPHISCIVCKQGTEKGPVYRCWSCYAFFIHHQCAVQLMEDVRHECHAHPLCSHTSPEVGTFNCYGCGGQGQSVCYSCAECPSTFHLECAMKLTLTPSINHKCHWHPLVLTSTPPKDDSDEYYCEVCAQQRHGDHWIYHCKPCEYEAHPHCVNPDISPYSMPERKESSKKSRGESEDDSDVYEKPSEEEKEDEEEASSEEEDEEEVSSEEGSFKSDSDHGSLVSSQINMPQNYHPCPHIRLCHSKKSENLVGLIVAVTGPTSPRKTALATEIAKTLRCTFLEYDQFRSCIPAGYGSASGDDLAYRIVRKMIETHLDRRNHHIVVDHPLSHRVELEQLLGITESHDAVVNLIDCEPGCRSEARPHDREGEATLSRDLERSLTMEEEQGGDCFYDYDPSEINVPRLVIGATSDAELGEHIETVKKLILTSLDKKFTEVDGTAMSCCNRCILDAMRREFARFPNTFKHALHDDEFHMCYPEDLMQKLKNPGYNCGACLCCGDSLCYSWGKLFFHPECVLELPLEIKHKCHWHPLKLTLLPPKDDTDEYYCEVCTERRDADSWIYYCQGCEYEAHVPCVVPNLPGGRKWSPEK